MSYLLRASVDFQVYNDTNSKGTRTEPVLKSSVHKPTKIVLARYLTDQTMTTVQIIEVNEDQTIRR